MRARIVAILCAAFALAASSPANVITFYIKPSTTDQAIHTFDDPHWMYIDRDICVNHKDGATQDRHQLLLWLTGTGGKGHDAQRFLEFAASLGYHAVNLMYPDAIPASTCDADPDQNMFEAFRMAIIQGGSAAQLGGRQPFEVANSESIEYRLSRLLELLQRIRPRENWGQFLEADGSIHWENIAVAGQSQGGGHAALIGIKHHVARVICFGAPKDYSTRYRSPAAWYGDASATPKICFFAFNHTQDPMGCTPHQLYENLQALQLDAFGDIAFVDKEEAPYHHSRILYTTFPEVHVTSVSDDAALTAHTSGINDNNAERFKPVWTYMLTEPTK